MTAEASLSSLLHLCPQSQCWAHIRRRRAKSWCGGTAQPGASAHGLQTGGFIPGCSWDAFCLDLETIAAVAKFPISQISKENTAHAMDCAMATRSHGMVEGKRHCSPTQPQPLLAGGRHGAGCGTHQAPTQAPSELLLLPLSPRERFEGFFNY